MCLQMIMEVLQRIGVFCKKIIRRKYHVALILMWVCPFYFIQYSGYNLAKLQLNKEIFNAVVRLPNNADIPKHFFDTENNHDHSAVDYDIGYIFTSDFNITETQLKQLKTKSQSYCGEKFLGFANLFAALTDVLLDPTKNYNRQGGEDIVQVQNQPENAEYLTLDKGYFKLLCPNYTEGIDYNFIRLDKFQPNLLWLKSLTVSNTNESFKGTIVHDFTIAVQRYEYVNVYHAMTDWYNAFLMAVLFHQNPNKITILWMDAHPKGSLDTVWRTLFKSTIQASKINSPIIFQKLVWSINGYDSFINRHLLSSVPYLEEFRSFVLHQFDVITHREKSCKSLRIVFSWRRNYVAHPRNIKGTIQRKILNEDELLHRTREYFVGHKIAGIQLDSLSFQEQLHIIVNSDILIGMHGAGMILSIFLPKHAGLIELFPKYFSIEHEHFIAMAEWRGLKYRRWQNQNPANENKNYYTYIQPNIIIDLIRQIQNSMCHI